MVLHDLAVHLLVDLRDQILQPHHAAGPGFEGFAVPAVHGAEAQEFKLCLRFHDPGLSGRPEHLRKVQFLALVHHVDHLIGIIQLAAHHQRRKVGRVVEGGSVRL